MKRKFFLLLPALLVLICLLAPVLAPWDPNKADPTIKFAKMSASHWLGTDYLGRDIFSRVLWGGRRTMGYSALVTAASAVFGTCLGMLSGFTGGVFDSVVMKGSDILRSFPGIVLVLIVVSVRAWGSAAYVWPCSSSGGSGMRGWPGTSPGRRWGEPPFWPAGSLAAAG